MRNLKRFFLLLKGFFLLLVYLFFFLLIINKIQIQTRNIKAIFLFLLLFIILCHIISVIDRSRFSLLKWIKRTTLFTALEDIVHPFYQHSTQLVKSFYLLLTIGIIPFGILLYITRGISFYKNGLNPFSTIDPIIFWGFWLSISSIMITARIYFEIKDKDKHSLEDFLCLVTEFLHRTRTTDEVYIIMPTLFIGRAFHISFYNNFTEKLFHLCQTNSNKIELAFLDFGDETNIDNFIETHNNTKNDLERHQYLINMIIDAERKQIPLFIFHIKWYPYNKNEQSTNWNQYYCELYSFIHRLLHIKKENPKSVVKINKIKNYYFGQQGNTGSGKNGFFLFANITAGNFYFGSLSVNSQNSIYFNGTLFENEHIGDTMKDLFHNFLASRTT
jgi:hypothetical protein